MEATRAIAISLILLGIGGMGWGAVEYAQSRESVDIGEIRLVKEDRQMPVQVPIGAALFAAGVILYLVGARQKAAIA